MTIVALDTYPINPGDLDWTPVTALAPSRLYDRTAPAEVYERVKDAEIILTNKVPIDEAMLRRLPALKYIGVMATGYNIVDTTAAHALGVTVTNVPAYSTESVAQLVFALILELTHHTGSHSERVHEGKWVSSADFTFRETPLVELSQLTLGILGYGAIGKAVSRIAQAFGMRIIAASRTPFASTDRVRLVDTEELFRESDILSIHCPLTPETKQMVNAARLAVMKPSAFLVNTSRGPIVDEQALSDTLNAGGIAGAAVDVLSVEPPGAENPLLTAKNCVITPHIGWATFAARKRLIGVIASNIRAFLSGAPANVVSK